MNKEESKLRIGIKFAIICICSLFAGFIMGGVAAMIRNIGYDGSIWVQRMAYIVPAVFFAGELIFFILTVWSYAACKKTYKAWNGEDEAVLDILERKLDIPLICTSVAMIFGMAFFPICTWLSMETENTLKWMNVVYPITMALFVAGIVWITVMQNAIIKFLKVLNPEKRGSVLEMDFQKKWVDSCDEGQKFVIYKSSYVAYRATATVCMTLWLISFVALFAFDTGIFPVLCVCIIYMTLIVSYSIASIKLEGK